jgi:hypothetical protein
MWALPRAIAMRRFGRWFMDAARLSTAEGRAWSMDQSAPAGARGVVATPSLGLAVA